MTAKRVRARNTGVADKEGLPGGIGAPARRALEAAGYTRLEQLRGVSEARLLELHGMGPKALARLRAALAARAGRGVG